MENLTRRQGSANWYYREAVPSDVRAILKSRDGRAPKDVWVSLRTPDIKIAKLQLVREKAKQHAIWDNLRNSVTHRAGTVPSHAELAGAVIESVHQRYVTIHRHQLREQFAKQADVMEILTTRKQALALGTILPSEHDQAAMQRLAAAVVKDRNWDIRGDTVEGLKLEQEMIRLVTVAVTLARRDVINDLEGGVATTSRDELMEMLGVEPLREAKAGSTIIELFDLYAEAATKKQDTLATERKVVVLFAQFVGSAREVGSVTKSEFREFRNALQKVPANWQLRNGLKELSLREVAKQWHSSGGEGRSQKTVAKEWSGLSSFYSWLVKEGYCDENLTVGLAPKIDKRSGKLPVYTPEKIKAVFESALFRSCEGDSKEHVRGDREIRDWRYWIPLCAAYSGARAGEIAQLLCSDIREVDGIWLFDLLDDGDEQESPKSLKTAASKRMVPIHQALIDLGLLRYVTDQKAKGHAKLFPELKPCRRGMLSTPVSKFWQRYLKRLGIKERGLALHSFRHTFADAIRSKGGSDAVLGSILGHAKGTITAHYGTTTEGNLIQRKALIDLVDYGELHCLDQS